MAQATTKFIWEPDAATLERANVVRLMRKHGFESYWELVARSQDDPEWFWPAAIEDMGLEFSRPWDAVVDLSRGPEWATWFVGGKVNIAWNCVHRWAERRPEAVASVGLGEDGSRREQTFAELSREVTRLAEALVRLGVREGDRVAIFLPMSPEVPVASHACAHIGAVQVPIFSGFAAPAVAQRLQASEAKVAITTRASTRRGREVPMLEILEEARREAPSVEHVVVAPWDELVADSPGELPAAELDSEAPYLLTYTSGTTGTPKGVVHVQGGFLVSIAREVCYQADAGPDDRIHFVTDMGWIMGPWTVVGGHAMGSTLVFAEGAPGLAAGPALEADRVGAGVRARDLPHAHARADPARRAADRPLLAADDRHHRRAVEPRPVPLALRRGRRRALPDHQLLRRDRGRRVLPVADARDPDQGVLAGRACARDGDGRRRLGRQLGARRGRRARLPQAVPRDDARVLARPGAVPRHVLAPLARDLDARRLGLGRRGRVLVPARALRRHAEHRRQADRAGGARVGCGRPPVRRRGCGDRRPARREGRGGVDLLRRHARHTRSTTRWRPRSQPRWPATWARRSSRIA